MTSKHARKRSTLFQRLMHWRQPLAAIDRLLDGIEAARGNDDRDSAPIFELYDELATQPPGPLRDELFRSAGVPDPLVLREAYQGRRSLPTSDLRYAPFVGITAMPRPDAPPAEVTGMLQAVLTRILDGDVATV